MSSRIYPQIVFHSTFPQRAINYYCRRKAVTYMATPHAAPRHQSKLAAAVLLPPEPPRSHLGCGLSDPLHQMRVWVSRNGWHTAAHVSFGHHIQQQRFTRWESIAQTRPTREIHAPPLTTYKQAILTACLGFHASIFELAPTSGGSARRSGLSRNGYRASIRVR